MKLKQIISAMISLLGIYLSFQAWYTSAGGIIVSGFQVEGYYTSLLFIMTLILTLLSIKGRPRKRLTMLTGATIVAIIIYRILAVWGKAEIQLALWTIPILGVMISLIAYSEIRVESGS